MKLFGELKRRNVFRVALFYVVTAWLIIEVAETVLPLFDVPDGVLRGLVVLLVIGLVPALALSWIYELTPEGIKRDTELSVAELQSSHTSRKLNWVTLAVAVAAIGFMALGRMSPAPRVAAPIEASPIEAPAPFVVPPIEAPAPVVVKAASIAVLPFADLSPAGDQEYFSDGMAEEILNALVKVDGLQVASRTSSFAFKGQQSLGMRHIAETLGVRHVLEGSVRKAGDTLRITAQLIDAGVDRHLWSDTFDRPLTAENVFAIQDEIASAIVAALTKSLGIDDVGEVSVHSPTENFTAYDLYLRARAMFQARHGLDVADELLRQAIERDPAFARAWELRAAVASISGGYGYSTLSADELDDLGTEYAERALSLEPASATALASLAFMRSSATSSLRKRHDIAAIIRDLERALEIEPHNSSALNWLALTLGHVGQVEDALAVFRRCMQVDPLFAPCVENEYESLLTLQRYDAAFEHYLAAWDRGITTGGYYNFSLLAFFEQRTAFLQATNDRYWLPGWRRHGEIYNAYRDLEGDHRALVADLLEFAAQQDLLQQGYLRNLLIPLGAYDLVPGIPLLIWGEDFAGYRRSGQFRHFIRESGALDYWRAHGYPPQCRPLGGDDFACD
jgi:adenylate cyclase